MMLKTRERWAESDFGKQPDVHVDIDCETDHAISLDSQVENLPEENPAGKTVLGYIADNMRLPFPDRYFDGYLSSLSFMFVQHPEKQI